MSDFTKAEKKSLFQLEERKNYLIRRLEEKAPAESRELLQLMALIELRRNSVGAGIYASAKGPREAIEAVLSAAGTWITKERIIQELWDGGYITDKGVEGTINTTLNTVTDPRKEIKELKSGKRTFVLKRIGDIGPKMLVGYPWWPEPEK